jgi:hypothetical protein
LFVYWDGLFDEPIPKLWVIILNLKTRLNCMVERISVAENREKDVKWIAHNNEQLVAFERL